MKNTVKLRKTDFLSALDASRTTCLYCYKSFSPLNQMIRHVKTVHMSHSLQLGKYTTILCKRACQGKEKISIHYHCPECDVTSVKKERLQKHFETNHITQCLPAVPVPAEGDSSDRDRCILADASSGVYIVSKYDTGIDHPIHVMKRTTSESGVGKCSDRTCQEVMALAEKNDIFNLQCQHLDRVKMVQYQVDDWYSNYDVPATLSEQEKDIYHMHMSTIIRLEKIPVVQWEVNERYKYFSVFSNDKHNSHFERIFVSYDSKHQKFKCQCQNQKRTESCPHIILVKGFCSSKNISLAEKEKKEQRLMICGQAYEMCPRAMEISPSSTSAKNSAQTRTPTKRKLSSSDHKDVPPTKMPSDRAAVRSQRCQTFYGGDVYPGMEGKASGHILQCPKAMISKPAPNWEATAVVDGDFKDIKLSDYKGKWLVFFFYPLDFTFVCPTEIVAFNDNVEKFRAMNTEVVACSINSKYAHLAWTQQVRKDGGLSKLKIPLVSDITHKIAKDYGVYLADQEHALRGLFVIDPTGVLRQSTISDLPVGRSVEETVHLVEAFQHAEKHD